MSAASFQTILGKALADYCEQIGVNLDKNPFTDELRNCNSSDDVLKLLEEKAKAFKIYRDGNRKLINWLSPVVQVIHTLSGVLSEVVSKESNALTHHHVDLFTTRCLSHQRKRFLSGWMF
jgi:hypothetical protein